MLKKEIRRDDRVLLAETKKKRFRKFQAEYIKYIIEKGYFVVDGDYYKMLEIAGYKPDPITKGRIKRIMSHELVKQDTDNKVVQFYISQGITQDKVKALLDKAEMAAVEKNDASTLFSMAKYMAELFGVAPSKTKITETEEIDLTADLKEAHRKIKRTKENEE